MAVKIRFARGGSKKHPFYRLVAADKRMKRDGRYLEKLGTYDIFKKTFIYNKEGIVKWLATGAELTDTVNKLLIKDGFDLKPSYDTKAAEKRKAEAKQESDKNVEAKQESKSS